MLFLVTIQELLSAFFGVLHTLGMVTVRLGDIERRDAEEDGHDYQYGDVPTDIDGRPDGSEGRTQDTYPTA